MLEWLIIGGGIHGTYMGNYLTENLAIDKAKIKILDPNDELLSQWHHCTSNTGMKFLRSSVVQQIDTDPFSLQRFARKSKLTSKFTYPNDRPSLELFNIHAKHIIEKKFLNSLKIKGFAKNILVKNNALSVITDKGEIETKKVLISIGMENQLLYPDWYKELKKEGANIYHVFDKDFNLKIAEKASTVTVLGAGITAIQIALYLSKLNIKVSILSRHSIKVHQYDSDPGWSGKYLLNFYKENDFIRRREIIKKARNRGSIPQELLFELRYAIKQERVTFITDEVKKTNFQSNKINIALKNSDKELESDLVILATGFDNKRPGGVFIDNIIKNLELNCAPCGFPIIDSNLH